MASMSVRKNCDGTVVATINGQELSAEAFECMSDIELHYQFGLSTQEILWIGQKIALYIQHD